MKIREVNYPNPACCVPADTVQQAATIMRDFDIGSIPVVVDQQSRKLLGIITDRDLCCSVLAAGLDPKTTPIEKYVTLHPATCRDGDNVEKCERAMREHRLRRIPIVDAENRCIGIVALADVALRYKPECPGLWPRFPNLARKSQSQPEANVGLAIPIARFGPMRKHMRPHSWKLRTICAYDVGTVLRLTAINVTNKVALYNFLSTFGGTHFVTPRTYTAELGFHF